MYSSVFDMTLIQKQTKKYKYVSNPLSFGKNILWLNEKIDFIYSGQGNSPKDIKEPSQKMIVSLDMGAFLINKKTFEFKHFQNELKI